jgi:hypothetical protein
VDILKVFKVELCINENGLAHHTDKYDLMLSKTEKPKLVIRRGQEFFVNIYFNRPYNKDVDGISFLFSILGIKFNLFSQSEYMEIWMELSYSFMFLDGKPSLSHGTLVLVPLLSKGSLLFQKTPSWTAYIHEIDENSIKVQV